MKNIKLFLFFILLLSIKGFSQGLVDKNIIKDTTESFSTLNKKVIIYKAKTYFLSWKENDGERICIEDGNTLIENMSPFIPDYLEFKNIPKTWDIEDTLFWGLNGVLVRTDGHPLYIASKGVLERIPLSRLTYENYYLKRKAREKFEDKYEDKKIIFDRLIKTTYFDILTTKDGTPNYILYFENKISVWKLINDDWINYGTFDFSTNGFFTCFEHQKDLYLIDYNSTVYKINKNGLEKVTDLPDKLIDIALVVNKDTDTISYIKQTDIKNASSITQLIKEKSISIFKK